MIIKGERKRCPFCVGYVWIAEKAASHEGRECSKFTEARLSVQTLSHDDLVALAMTMGVDLPEGKA